MGTVVFKAGLSNVKSNPVLKAAQNAKSVKLKGRRVVSATKKSDLIRSELVRRFVEKNEAKVRTRLEKFQSHQTDSARGAFQAVKRRFADWGKAIEVTNDAILELSDTAGDNELFADANHFYIPTKEDLAGLSKPQLRKIVDACLQFLSLVFIARPRLSGMILTALYRINPGAAKARLNVFATLLPNVVIEAKCAVADTQFLPEIIATFLNDSEVTVHQECRNAIVKMSTQAMPALVEALESTSTGPQTKMRIISVLGHPKFAGAVPALIRATVLVKNYDNSIEFTQSIIESLGGIASDDAIAVLVKIVLEGDEHFARRACEALKEVCRTKSFKPLTDALIQNPSMEERSFVTQTLMELAQLRDAPASVAPQLVVSSNVAEPFLRWVLSHSDPKIRKQAAKTISERRDYTPQEQEQLTNALIPLLEDPDASVALEAAISLARLGSADGLPFLLHYLHSEDAERVDEQRPFHVQTVERVLAAILTLVQDEPR